MAIGLAEAGADIILLDRSPSSETRDRIEELGRKCTCLKVDLLHLGAVDARQIVKNCVEEMGGVDILVNNAGIIKRGKAEEFSEEAWQQVLDVNLNSVFFLSQAMAAYAIKGNRPGKIINMASMLSFQGGLTVPSYTASKSAIAGLTKALANEWASKGIHVNAIAPGYLRTEVTVGIYSDPKRNHSILERIPADRWGEPEDLKGIVVFLASDASSYVHGAVIPVDGGWLAR
ncbi:UNVERIFIED_CONTAM: hypothetical protein GTU68_056999 [Idotea baltica]|nr:hypothetical protein [Idotea baltica]